MRFDVRMHVFHFLLNLSLSVVVGLVLHKAETTAAVHSNCPALWESMVVILVMRCLRLTLCALWMRISKTRTRAFHPIDPPLYTVFFITECITASRSLNSAECVAAAGLPFDGHPLIAYAGVLLAVWDGCYVLSLALYAAVQR